MDELPENLQVNKSEQSSTPEKYTNNIKERLNLHVKRRLLQEAHSTPTAMPYSKTVALPAQPQLMPEFIAAAKTNQKSEQPQDKPKEQQRVRRPYQKRTNKANAKNTTALTVPSTITSISTSIMATSCATTPTSATILDSPLRKRRQKTRGLPQQQQPPLQQQQYQQPTAVRSEDDGSLDGVPDLETRSRDKEKCPDILGMVLSMKRRALFQDIEVQKFLNQIMSVIRS